MSIKSIYTKAIRIFNKQNNNQQLSHIQQILTQCKRINNGGCAIAAITMYRWLQQNNLHNNIVFVFGDKYSEEYNLNSQYINNKEITSSHHVYLYNPKLKYRFDCTGRISKYPYEIITDDINYVIQCINSLQHWNPVFERDKYIPIIQKRTGINLSDITF